MVQAYLLKYAWILAIILLAVSYKILLRVFGIVIVPEDKTGHVIKKFVLFGSNKNLPDGKIIACNGESGYQADLLSPGVHYFKWPWQYKIEMNPFITVPADKILILLAKDGKQIEDGRLLARSVECDHFQNARAFLQNGGQKGPQITILPPGIYKINQYLFQTSLSDATIINDNKIGIVTAKDGAPLCNNEIAGRSVPDHNNFMDFEKFIKNNGQKGRQCDIISTGKYYFNPMAISVEQRDMTEIPIGYVGVVTSFVGEEGLDVTGQDFKHGNIVHKGQKGIWIEPLGPGKYPINPYTTKVELVPTTNLVLNWADARTESHNLDQNLSTITVRSKDGFKFNLDVSQIIHIPLTEAPKVIARFGSMSNLVSQVLEPTIGNYFRNSAQDNDVISFLGSRQERQASAKEHIKVVLDEYNVNAVDTLIGDITPPAELMKTLTDRKLAQEQKMTYDTEKEAQKTRQELEKETALADIQSEIVTADQGVKISELKANSVIKASEGEAVRIKNLAVAEADKIKVLGDAEAGKTLAIGKAQAEAYTEQVNAMGRDNFTKFKVMEQIGTNKIKVTPEMLITGGSDKSNGPVEALLGIKTMEWMSNSVIKQDTTNEVKNTDTVVPTKNDSDKKEYKK